MIDSRGAGIRLWFALVLPSSFILQKYLGWGFTLAYAIVVAAILTLKPRLSPRLPSSWLRWLVLLVFAAVLAAFVIVYPAVNTHRPGAGSDDDDGLNVAASAMLAGRFPYSTTTYLGNNDHHLPGGLILAAPFVLLGTSALQNIFWIPMFFLVVTDEAGERTAVELAVLALAFSPAVMHEIVTGTGYAANAISVLLGLWWLTRTTHRDAASAFWGLTLASRANFIFLLPIAFGYLRQHAGTRAAWRATAVTSATIGALTLPFYLYDPRHFSPIEGANRLLVFDQLLPHLGAGLMLAMAALAAALSFERMDRAALFRSAALIQAFPVVAAIVLSSAQNRRLDLTYARYGAFFAWFAFLDVATRCTMSAAPQCPNQPRGD